MSVADLLAQSRAAHRQRLEAAGRIDKSGTLAVSPDYTTAAQHARRALRLRAQAHALDPQQTDPAWLSDQAANKGVDSATLCASLQRYVTPDTPREPKSIEEIERAVKASDPRASNAYALLLLENGWIAHQDLPKELQDSGVFQRMSRQGERA